MKFTYIDRPLEPLIGANEAAQYLGFSSLTVRRMARDGRLPSIAFPMGKSGRSTHRFRVSELKVYLTSLKRGPVAESAELDNHGVALRAG